MDIINQRNIKSNREHSVPNRPYLTYEITSPKDRHRFWVKVVQAGQELPLPSQVERACNIPGKFLNRGKFKLYPGDLVFGAWEKSRRYNFGWQWWVMFVTSNFEVRKYNSGFGAQKREAKVLGLSAEILAGVGDAAGAVRVGHALRLDLNLQGYVNAKFGLDYSHCRPPLHTALQCNELNGLTGSRK